MGNAHVTITYYQQLILSSFFCHLSSLFCCGRMVRFYNNIFPLLKTLISPHNLYHKQTITYFYFENSKTSYRELLDKKINWFCHHLVDILITFSHRAKCQKAFDHIYWTIYGAGQKKHCPPLQIRLSKIGNELWRKCNNNERQSKQSGVNMIKLLTHFSFILGPIKDYLA